MFDLSDHTLTTIGTWAEVAILLFMLFEKYAPKFGRGGMMLPSAEAPSGSRFWGFTRENRTIAVALVGLAIVGWLNLRDCDKGHRVGDAVSFDYANDPRHVVLYDGRIIVFIGVKPSKPLGKATPYLIYFHPAHDSENAPPISSVPFRTEQRLKLGWFESGAPAWQPRAVPESGDKFILFHLFDGGKRLSLFTITDTAEQKDEINNIPAGDYRIVIEVDDQQSPVGVTKKYLVHWTGAPGGFSMEDAN